MIHSKLNIIQLRIILIGGLFFYYVVCYVYTLVNKKRSLLVVGGGYGFLFRSEIVFRITRVRIFIFFVAQSANFFPEFNIRLYDKNSESNYFFFSSKRSSILLLDSSCFSDFKSFQYCFGSASLSVDSLSNISLLNKFLFFLIFFFTVFTVL
jgi:hypothetical protein